MIEISESAVYVFWTAAILIFGIIEAVTAQLVSIWFLVGAIGAVISAACGADILIQIVVFIAVTIIALIFTRPLVKRFINPKKQKTNADKAVGQTGIVTVDIDNINSAGQVKVLGNVWSARSENGEKIPSGSRVTVKRIEGVKLIVETEN